MKIWVDADACPVVIREILFKAAKRTGTDITLVANKNIRIPVSSRISMLLVPSGRDVADQAIVTRLTAGDLVITSDIPLAAEVIAKGGFILTPRGENHTAEDIRTRLSMRDFMETLRSDGIETGGPPPMRPADRSAFANQLDRLLARQR